MRTKRSVQREVLLSFIVSNVQPPDDTERVPSHPEVGAASLTAQWRPVGWR
jgi:hypothetical protein